MIYSLLFFNDTATTEIDTLSLHDALPIWRGEGIGGGGRVEGREEGGEEDRERERSPDGKGLEG